MIASYADITPGGRRIGAPTTGSPSTGGTDEVFIPQQNAKNLCPSTDARPPMIGGRASICLQNQSARTRQPYLSSTLPVWMPVMVSYSFWVTGPMLPSPMVMTSSM